MKFRAHICYAALFLALSVPLLASAASAPITTGSEDQLEKLSFSISRLASIALAYAGVLAAAGTVAMAFVELIKGLFDLRKYFLAYMLNAWLGEKKDVVLPELLYLAIADKSHESVLCGQPLEKMMGQLQAAARIALDYPEQFPNLFRFLASTDFESLTANGVPAAAARHDRDMWHGNAKTVRDISAQLRHASANVPPIQNNQNTNPPSDPAKTASDAAQAKARLASLVGRKLDGFQLRTQFWWDRSNQAFSILISIVVLELAASTLELGQVASFSIGLIGGLLAPFAKDFSQSLAKFAGK